MRGAVRRETSQRCREAWRGGVSENLRYRRCLKVKTCNRRWFTFVEVMVVLAIMTLISVIALPAFRAMYQSERERDERRRKGPWKSQGAHPDSKTGY